MVCCFVFAGTASRNHVRVRRAGYVPSDGGATVAPIPGGAARSGVAQPPGAAGRCGGDGVGARRPPAGAEALARTKPSQYNKQA